jgi:antitoxin component YwqK of YwqJK toxin-antitoxin module
MVKPQLIFLVFIFVLFVSCTSNSGDPRQDNINQQERIKSGSFKTYPGLEARDGLYYKEGTDSLFTGSTESYYDNDTSFVKADFKDGQLHGKYEAYYANGQKMGITHYKKGVKHGKSIGFHENGNKASKTIFEKGKKDSLLVIFYPNGQKRLEANYKNGRLNGGVTQWKSDGTLYSIKSYAEGELEWEEYYNQQANTEQPDNI